MVQKSLAEYVDTLDKASLLTRYTEEKRVDELPALMEPTPTRRSLPSMPQVEGRMSEGQEVTVSFSGKEPFRWRMSAFKPTTHVHWECLEGPGAAKGTAVTYQLTGENGQTVLARDHDGWPENHGKLATCHTLWGILMGRLKAFAETGEANPVFT